ncbi:MAG: universal bacterial protein YeaZ [Francisellaceae bacterium]|nr:universal bacterial protein YeaZ [Francisellaceae bacterium]
MKINLLAIDTTTEACSLALYTGGEITSHFEIAPQKHTGLILPLINNLLKLNSITIKEVDLLTFCRGPGSFTGVRIATSLVQGLSLGLQKPVLPISTLRTIAQGAYRKKQVSKVLSKIDARMSEIYWGLFELDKYGIMQAIESEQVSSNENINFDSHKQYYATDELPDAQDLIPLALADYEKGLAVLPEQAQPIYVRDKVV